MEPSAPDPDLTAGPTAPGRTPGAVGRTPAAARVAGRRGLLAAAGMSAALLVGTAAWNLVGVRERADDLAAAEGDALVEQARRTLWDAGPPSPESATATFEAVHDAGVTWLGLLDSSDGVLFEVGERPPGLVTVPQVRAVPFGDQMVMTIPPERGPRGARGPRWGRRGEASSSAGASDLPPDGPPDGLPPGGPPDGLPPELAAGGGPPDGLTGGPAHVRPVLAFRPTYAPDLVWRSTQALGVSVVGAALLLAGAWISARTLARAEAAEADLARHQQLAALGQVSAVLAHELRNPLAALKGHAQLLAELLAGGPHAPRADRVVGEAGRLERLVNDLLDFAREARVDRAQVDPVRVVRAVAEATDPARVRILAERAPAAWSLDAARMRQVLLNLVSNALAADEAGGPVEVEVAEVDGALVYAVRDRGPGLVDVDRERMFEPFYTTRAKGTGLGLAVSRRLVGLHGGRLDARDRDGGGAELVATIPRGG